jgi:hypothetical protein
MLFVGIVSAEAVAGKGLLVDLPGRNADIHRLYAEELGELLCILLHPKRVVFLPTVLLAACLDFTLSVYGHRISLFLGRYQ